MKVGADYELVAQDLATGARRQLTHDPSWSFGGQVSPDGRWIAYVSNESGAYQVYVQPFPATGRKWLVSTGSGSHPLWTGNGRELFYLAAEGRVMSVDVTSDSGGLTFSSPRALLRIPVRLGVPYYDYDVTSDGQRFLVLAPAAGSTPEPLSVLVNWHAALRP